MGFQDTADTAVTLRHQDDEETVLGVSQLSRGLQATDPLGDESRSARSLKAAARGDSCITVGYDRAMIT